MNKIKKKLMAIAVVCAMAVSMSACSDRGDSSSSSSSVKDDSHISAENVEKASLSSEEIEKLKNVDLTITEYTPDNQDQDPVEGNNSSADSSESSADPQGNSSVADPNSSSAENNNSSSNDNNSNNQNDNSQNDNNNQNNDAGVIKGTKKTQLAYWINLAGDFVFDGDYIVATFKIKETTPNGTYPITIDLLDFSNIKPEYIEATGINGNIVVGGDTTPNVFKNDGSFEVMADNVSGNPGDTVTVAIKFNHNPGICAAILRFSYDSDAVEYVSGTKGEAFLNALTTQNQNG